MLDKAITREGILIMIGGHVYLEGWETNDGMCREVAALACLYAARELMERGMALIAQPGGDKRTCIGLPDGAPKEWEYNGDPDDTWMDEQDEMRVAEQQPCESSTTLTVLSDKSA